MQENFQADEDEYDTAEAFRTLLIPQAKETAGFYADGRTDESRTADTERGVENRYAHESKGNTYCQGIDAGGDGQYEHGPDIESGATVIFLFTAA